MEEKRRDSTNTPPPPSATAKDAPASEQPTSRRRGGGQKRKSTSLNSGGGGSSNLQTTSSKRQAREKPIAIPFTPIHTVGPCTRARVQPNSSVSFFLPSEAPVKSDAEARELAARAEEMSLLTENREALEAKIEAEYEAIKSRDASVHVVPVHAGWFSWTKIHPLEKNMLPSFFSGKVENRTAEVYMEIRNWIMKKFHFNPSAPIELDHLSELTVGEPDARQEVMEFLDYWGLINYHPFPQNEPAAMSIDADETGKTESLAEKLFKFETVESWSPVVPRMNAAVPTVSSGLFPEAVIADELVKFEEPAVDYHCNSCSADCSRKRYHCQKQADFDLCAECFNNGKFGSDMSPSDFILMEPAEAGGASGGNWTDQETILLLEAIEIFKDNWSEIAEHVATKTKSQCILHFVQMPIEDAFFNHDNENNAAPKENSLPVSIITEDPSPKEDQDRDTAPKEDQDIDTAPKEDQDRDTAPKEDQDRDTAPKDDPDKMESQAGATENQSSSCPMEISKPDDVKESDGSNEVGDSFALKALKEAFEAVGGSPLPGEKLSFAEAGNPVMALAAFLVQLVEPSIATASVCSLLKSLSSCRSSEQLAARHCFHLEHPPDDKKNSEGATNGTIEPEVSKHEDDNVEKQNEDKPDSVVGGANLQDEEKDKNKDSAPEEHKEKGKNKDSASEEHKEKGKSNDSAPEEHKEKKEFSSEEKKQMASPSRECAERSDTMKEPDGIVAHETKPASMNGPRNSDIPEQQTTKNSEESIVLASHTGMEDLKNVALNGNHSQSKEPREMISNSEKKETELLMVSNSTTEKEKDTGDTKDNECGSEKKETMAKNDLETNKLRRAAVAAISAAAVKAKLLADHEEDQIRQLATLLIEKQLHKLETKLAFFNDMENVVMRAKEQLDRSKQRLFHERAQIIATRFGMSASARPTTQSLPPNRAGVTFPNSASRPFIGMNSLRPPISRPIMAPNSTSGTSVHTSAPGSSVQPNADNTSSVGTK